MIRLGRYGEQEAMGLETGIMATGWQLNALTEAKPFGEILAILQHARGDEKPGTLRNWAVQLNNLCNYIHVGDWIVLPLKTTRQIAVGEVTRGYFLGPENRPSVAVKWLRADIPRDAVRQDLLFSLGAAQTICEIARNNAFARIKALVETGRDPGYGAALAPKAVAVAVEAEDAEGAAEETTNLAEVARDQIERHISSRFVGHRFTHLIAAILRVDGFETHISPPGADKGVDIVAGQGSLAFGGPRLVVQVKSGDQVVDQPTLQGLIGCVHDTQADFGLMVSWSGFTTPVLRRVNELYFRVRLWGRDEIMDALLRTYDRLPEDIRTDLPLQRVWAMVPDEG